MDNDQASSEELPRYRLIGPAFHVTDAEDNMIREVANKPALTRLREVFSTLDDRDRSLARCSLHVCMTNGTPDMDSFVHVIGADPGSGAIAVANLVAVGEVIQFCLPQKPVSRCVIEARVRETLIRRGEVLHFDEAWDGYFTKDTKRHLVERENLTLEQLAVECDALRPGEVIEE